MQKLVTQNKKNETMKILSQITFLIIGTFAILTSCNKDSSGSCSSGIICYTDAPDSLWVKLNLINPDYDDSIFVKLYVGNMDDGEVYDSFKTINEEEYYLVPVNQDYTATAQFLVENNDTIIVIDSDRLNRRSCLDGDATCYDWDHEITLDLTLDMN